MSLKIKGSGPKLSIVIPTRERSDTLYKTLRTVVSQAYSNLEIIVSDNYSQDNTKDVVHSFNDSRIRYSCTEKRLGMSSNWEHGLSLVSGDYVMFLGDDDGLLPEACNDVASLLGSFKMKTLIWLKPDYNWPGAVCENELSILMANELLVIDSKILLRALAFGLISYGRLPSLYSGFVSTEVINAVKKRSGKFFCSVTPDVYSGIVLASQLESYYYSTRPFSVNGGSVHSNGQAIAINSNLAQVFFSEADIPFHPKIPFIPGCITSFVAEAFLQAQDRHLTGSFRLNEKRYYSLISRELASLPAPLAANGIQKLAGYNIPKKIRKRLNDYSSGVAPQSRKSLLKKSANNKLTLNAGAFNIYDVYDACQLVYNIIGRYSLPDVRKKADFKGYLFTIIYKVLKGKLDRYTLPF